MTVGGERLLSDMLTTGGGGGLGEEENLPGLKSSI